jgi:hypothetical protein
MRLIPGTAEGARMSLPSDLNHRIDRVGGNAPDQALDPFKEVLYTFPVTALRGFMSKA